MTLSSFLSVPRTGFALIATLLCLASAGATAASPDAPTTQPRERVIIFPILTPKNKDPQVRERATESLRAGLSKSKILEIVVFDPSSTAVTDAVKRGRLSPAQITGPFTSQTAPQVARALGGTYAVIGNVYGYAYIESAETWGMSFWVKILAADNGEILKETGFGSAQKVARTDDTEAEAETARQLAAKAGTECARLLLDPRQESGVTMSKNLKNGKDW